MRTALAAANANRPKGSVAGLDRAWSLSTTDQLLKAAEYQPLIIHYANGAALRLSDIATVTDSVEDIRTAGSRTASPPSSSSSSASRAPTSSRPSTASAALLPQLQASIPPTIALLVAIDATRRSARRSATSRSRS